MDDVLYNKIQAFLSQSTFQNTINNYSKKHPALNLKIFCTDDPLLIKSFVFGILFSTLSKIVSDHYPRGVDTSIIVEMIKILDAHANSK